MADVAGQRKIDRPVWWGALLARYIRFVRAPRGRRAEMDGADRRRQLKHHPVHRRHVARPVHAAAAHQAARSSRSTSCWRGTATPAFLGEALKHFDMQLIRGAGAAGRGKDRGGSHAYTAAVQALREGRAVAMTADVPGGQARRAGPRHRHGGAPVGQADPARRDRHHALHRAQHLEPDDDQPALFGPGLRRRPARAACRARRAPRSSSAIAQAVEDGSEQGDRAGLRPRRRRPDARHARLRRCRAAPSRACGSRPIARSPAWRARWRRCCSACASGAARRSRCGATSGWASRASPAPGGAPRLVSCRQRGRDQRHPPADVGAGRGAPVALLPAHHRHGDLGQARRPAPGPARHPSVRAARCARVRRGLSRPLAAGPRRLHRVGDLAQPDPGKLGARHSARRSSTAA